MTTARTTTGNPGPTHASEFVSVRLDLPGPVVDTVLEQLAHSVRALRSIETDVSEELLAKRVQDFVEPQWPGLLDDPTRFLVLSHCLWFQCGHVSRTGEPETSEEALSTWLAEWGVEMPALVTPGVELGRFVAATYREITSGELSGLSELNPQSCVLAGLAFSAPDTLWETVELLSGTLDPASRGVSAFSPNAVVSAIATVEENLSIAVRAAERRLQEIERETPRIERALSDHELDAHTDQVLTEHGIGVGSLEEMLRWRLDYRAAGVFKKMILGDPRSSIEEEARKLLRQWQGVRERAREELGRARTARQQRLDALRMFGRPFDQPFPAVNPGWPDLFQQYDRYRRTEPSVAGALGALRAMHNLWTVDPIPDQPWGHRMTYLDTVYLSVLFVAGDQGLSYEQGCRAATAIVLDQMSRALPGRLTLTWIDPRGRGQSAGPLLALLEQGKHLIDDSVWSEPEDISAALRRVSDRMSQLEQRALKDAFPNLDAYNETAGELAEPNQVVVVTGYPKGFTEESAGRLRQIIEGGARLGISVLVVADPQLAGAYELASGEGHFLEGRIRRNFSGAEHWWRDELLPVGATMLGHNGRAHAPLRVGDDVRWVPCDPLEFSPEAAQAIVTGYAGATSNAAEVKIDSSALADDEGPGDTTSSVDIPLGLQGRRDKVILRLGQGLTQNVLIGGLPGSGKSALLHTLIVSAIRRYAPDELELYLLDFKQGVEFQPYAEGALPHARVVAVQSERDFGLSVLRDLRAEIDRRAELLRGPDGAGSDNLSEYRKRTGAHLPRVVVVIDEFQVLFAEDDRIAHECAQLLDHVVRQGRAFGVHTVLGTQTLRGHGAMSLLRGTLDQVAVRIVLKTSESDSRLFLADDNPAGSRLSRPGQAIFNGDGGRPEGNVEFQVAFTEDEDRDAVVSGARQSADQRGFDRGPRVFDGTKAVDVRHDEDVRTLLEDGPSDGKRLRLHLGLPVAIKGSGGVALRRAGGNNLLLVHREPAQAVGALTVALATARLSTPDPVRIVGVDCLGVDDDEDQRLDGALEIGDNATCVRHAKLAATLETLATEVRRRIDFDDPRAERTLLVLNALQRARALGDENSYAEPGSPRENLSLILTEGPEYGVHTVVVTDSAEAVDRRLGHQGMAQFGARVVGQCSVDASQRILGTGAASKLGEHYVILHEPEEDRTETLRLFPAPDESWRERAATIATERKAAR